MVESTTTGTIEHAAKKPSIAFTRIGREEVKAEIWGCGDCGTVHPSESIADECCACQRCGKADPRGGQWAKHVECKRLDEAERSAIWAGERAVKEARVLLAATPIEASSYAEPVFWGERFIQSVDDVEAEYECSDSYEEGMPSFVFGSTRHTLQLDADATLETALSQDHVHEGAEGLVSGEAKNALAQSIAAWNDTFGSTVASFTEDQSVVVVLDQAGFEEELEAARLLLAELTIVKALIVALYLLTARESVQQETRWHFKPWAVESWWKTAS